MAAHDTTLPDLQLHDIIHSMSPSPTPQQTENLPRGTTPEPLTEAEIVHIRHRVSELSLLSKETSNFSEREKELLGMVRRLTESSLLDPGQLLRQAEIISGLTSQRDFLVLQAEEERERWASQRDGWERTAEALIAQRNKTTNIGNYKESDVGRYCSAYESDNRALREKLHDSQTRLQCLETEITKLRPILLMQPGATPAFLASLPYPNVQVAAEKAKPKKKKMKKEPRVPVFSAIIPDEQTEADEELTETQPTEQLSTASTSNASFFQFQAQPVTSGSLQPAFTGDHYRKPPSAPVGGPLTDPPTTLEFQVSASAVATPTTTTPAAPRTIRRPSLGPEAGASNTPTRQGRLKGRRGSQGTPLTPLTSDARTEHLLLAARKIGRERAWMMSGHVQNQQQEQVITQKQEMTQKQEREARQLARGVERERAEKEKQERSAGGSSYYRRSVVEAGPSGSAMSVTPQTPKKGGNSHYPNVIDSPQVVNASFVLVEPPKVGVMVDGGNGGGVQAGSNVNLPNTPQPQHAAASASGSQKPQSQGPSTPLASLLDAARMMDDGKSTHNTRNGNGSGRGRKNILNGNGGPTTSVAAGKGRRRGVAAVDQPENPVPKRRRVASAKAAAAAASSSKTGGDEEREAPGRVRSGLDVLADQAAAFSSSDQRGKEKAREVPEAGEETMEDSRSPVLPPKRGRAKGKAAVKEKEIEREKEKEKEKEMEKEKEKEKEREKERENEKGKVKEKVKEREKEKERGKEKGKEKEKPKPKPKPAVTRKPRAKATVTTPSASSSSASAVLPRLISPPEPKATTSATHETLEPPLELTGTSLSSHVFKPPSLVDDSSPVGARKFVFREVTTWGRRGSDGTDDGSSGRRSRAGEARRVLEDRQRRAGQSAVTPVAPLNDIGQQRVIEEVVQPPAQVQGDVEMHSHEEEDVPVVVDEEMDVDVTQPAENSTSYETLETQATTSTHLADESQLTMTEARTSPEPNLDSLLVPDTDVEDSLDASEQVSKLPLEADSNGAGDVADPDPDADADVDDGDGEADAEGEVDAEGDPDPGEEMDVASLPAQRPQPDATEQPVT